MYSAAATISRCNNNNNNNNNYCKTCNNKTRNNFLYAYYFSCPKVMRVVCDMIFD